MIIKDIGCHVRNYLYVGFEIDPILSEPTFINVHRIAGEERKRLLQREINRSEVMIFEPLLAFESHINKRVSFLDILPGREHLRIEQIKKSTQGELCLNMK